MVKSLKKWIVNPDLKKRKITENTFTFKIFKIQYLVIYGLKLKDYDMNVI